MAEVNKNIPIIFQKLKQYNADDTRFLQVKIWLMHIGENLNGSYFEKSVVEDAIPSLANTPILAYIEDNSDGEVDFSDHRVVLIKDDGQYKLKYIGQAIGVIPETNNAQFEKRVCDDGIEREFLTVEGLIWTKFDDPIEIMNRDKTKAESMELHDNYQGEFLDDNLFHFTFFEFFGACALGTNVLPAMRSASIELNNFSFDSYKQEIQEKMEQFKKFTLQNQSSIDVDNKLQKEGGEKVEEKLELLKKYSLTPEQLSFSIDELSVEELEAKIKSEFSLTAEQFRDELVNKLREEQITDDWGWTFSRYSYVDHKDNMVFAFDRSDDYKLYGFEFSTDNDSITINFESKKRKKFEIVDFEEGMTDFSVFPKEAIDYSVQVKEKEISDKFTIEKDEAVKAIQKNFDAISEKCSTLEAEATSLRDFKTKIEKDNREIAEKELFEKFVELNDVKEYEELKTKSSEFTLNELEEKFYAILGKKNANFSISKNEKPVIKLGLNHNEDDDPYGGLVKSK